MCLGIREGRRGLWSRSSTPGVLRRRPTLLGRAMTHRSRHDYKRGKERVEGKERETRNSSPSMISSERDQLAIRQFLFFLFFPLSLLRLLHMRFQIDLEFLSPGSVLSPKFMTERAVGAFISVVHRYVPRFKVSKVVVVGKKKVEVSRAASYAYLGIVGALATACLSSYSQSARYNQRPS